MELGGKIMKWRRATELEVAKEMFRRRRKYYLQAFDIWEKNVLRGREQDSQEVLDWYQTMLDFPDSITENTTFQDYPQIPEVLKNYLK